MNTIYSACPIVTGVIDYIKGKHRRESWPNLYLSDGLYTVELDAAEEQPAHARVQARAFHVVELIYREIIPRALFFLRADAAGLREIIESTYPRTATGLRELQQDVNKLKHRVAAVSGIASIRGNRENSSLQTAKLYADALPLLDAANDAAQALCQCLDEEVPLPAAFGSAFGCILVCVRFTQEELVETLQAVLSVEE